MLTMSASYLKCPQNLYGYCLRLVANGRCIAVIVLNLKP